MSNQDDPEKKGEGKASNWVWYLVLTCIILLSVGVFFVQNSILRLKYPDLMRLLSETRYVEKGSTELLLTTPGEDGQTVARTGSVVIRNSAQPDRTITLSKIRDVRIDETTITGMVHQVVRQGDKETSSGDTPFRSNKDSSDETANELRHALDRSKVNWEFSDGPGFMNQYGPVLIMIGAIFLIMMFAARRMSGIGSPMSFGRSRGKLYAQDDIGITFEDIAGVEEAVEEVREIVDFLKYPEKYQRLGGRIPKGVLLVGPPGTGKTLLAKAIAGEAGVPFFSLSGSDFVEMFVGVGAARVRDMFQQASAKAPCIIFIDELDALGKSRSGNSVGVHDEREQTLNALLVEMDGFGANVGIIIIAATNRPETLDPALLRPGRFDRNVLVDRPDKSGRADILKVHVKNVKLGTDVDLQHIASITSGFSGADLGNLVNEAALLAARKGKNTVGQPEFDEGVERVTAGLEKKSRIMDEEEKRRVAYHEAAHALVACSLPDTDPVHKVSIIPRGLAALGYTMQRPAGERFLMTQAELEAQMQVLLAGTLAEEIVFKDISTGAQNDLERASAIARSMVMEFGMSRLGRVNYRESGRTPFLGRGGGEAGVRDHSEQTAREIDEEVRRIVDDMLQKARQILLERRQALESITDRLIEIEVMDAEELNRLIDETIPGPRFKPGTQGISRDAPVAPETPSTNINPASDTAS
ncbi:ATP-dependent zinc metalloprotease FtsH [Aureliella helgolandensis]|uniref:ATP-dependent zinc metalloprotease FtsH n=2 Tax=Aureliella helgolandensis TaxID=2527968 RepID=A0A518G405_9BACT|nr:ATP-dependent zinc metalloprotease FtsH [Aureliella helgolandensis]QDV23331.1 ATP-dependent zinc metalloprotease FtsH 4 [Aureliella helgolandensis]